jgi:transcription termination/antitermination protein NusA
MNGNEILRIVDAIHRDKNIDKEIVFEGIEQAIISAARKHFGEESEITVDIDRESGEPSAQVNGTDLQPDEIGDLLGRIAAQTAKQVMIQKIREAERDSLYDEYTLMRGQMVSGSIAQVTGGAATVNLGKVEGLLPRSEMIPGEVHRVGERVRAVVLEVKKAGSRVKIILSRTHPEMVRRLFELEIPEIAEHIIEVRSLAREAGYRSKVAVSCIDSKIDCVGACVGVRGSRIRNIVDELAGERIDIVRWNDSLQVLVPNSLQPAEVEDVILCPMLGKVIVLVREDQLSLSIGKKGQNVRLASKLVGWDIHVLTQEKLDVLLDSAVEAFSQVPNVTSELAENLVAQGFFTFDDLSVIEPDQLAELSGLSAEEVDAIVEFADAESERIEAAEKRARQEDRALRKREAEIAEMEASAGVKLEPAHAPEREKKESAGPAAVSETSVTTEEAAGGDAESEVEAVTEEAEAVTEKAVSGNGSVTDGAAVEEELEAAAALGDAPSPAVSGDGSAAITKEEPVPAASAGKETAGGA